jgi:hypothetical protein
MSGFTHPWISLLMCRGRHDGRREARWTSLADGLQQEPREQPVNQGRHAQGDSNPRRDPPPVEHHREPLAAEDAPG